MQMTRRFKVLGIVAGVLVVALSALMIYLSHDAPCGAPQALPAGAKSMQAIVYRCYGTPTVLRLEQVAQPPLADDRVLVKVQAAALNPLDWHYMRGKPYIMRLEAGIGAPGDIRLGTDFAGTVVAVGRNVTRYKPGDAVFGGADGALAEYVSVAEGRALAHKPANITFQQAAGVPIAAVTALQALRDKGALRPGQKVLINGASGGVGTFAVQIAKALGGEVTAVCSARNAALVRSIGADHVIDYAQEDFSQGAQRYELILDTVGNHSLADLRRVLGPTGIVVMVGGAEGNRWTGPLGDVLAGVLWSKFLSQKFMFMLADLKPQDLATLGEMMQAGKVTPVIDRSYPLSETPAAIGYLEEGHARGKVVIDVASDQDPAASAKLPEVSQATI
jgi:NADPH:quinone reductase-like Zn-dependent oxidoreductase